MRLTVAVFLVAQALYLATASGWPWRAPDEFETYFQTESLVTRGSLAVPQLEGRAEFFGKKGLDGDLYAPYGPLLPFVLAPAHAAARAVTPDPWARAGLTCLVAATAGALAVAGFFRAASKRTTELNALLLSGALMTSVLWPYSKTLFSESFSAAAFIWTWVFLQEKRLAAASVLLGLACLLKSTNAVFALPLALASEHRVTLMLGVIGAGLVHMEWNTHRFGTPLELGYNWHETIVGKPQPFGGSLVRGLFVLLLSPGKSLFVWAPCLLLALPHMKKDREIAITGAVGLLVFAKYMFPEGGYCHGPRHLVPIVPLLLLPATHGFSRRALGVLAVLGAAMNGLAASVSYLEDQSLEAGFVRHVYYDWDTTVPDGQPRNVYRLAYCPQVSLVKTLLASTGAPGTGPDFLFRHVRREVGRVPLTLGVASLIAGLLASRRPLLTDKNAAILPPRSP